jgi:hypothetical protein
MDFRSLCIGIKPYSIPEIQISLSFEKVGLMFTTKLSFFKKSMLISNQKAIKSIKFVILNIFLVFLEVGVESQHEHIEWFSQIHEDYIDEFSILILIVLSKFTQFQLEFFGMH